MIGQCGDASAAINLVEFEQQFPDTDTLRSHTVTLKFMAGTIGETVQENHTTWAALQNPGVYTAPEQETVYSAMDPAVTAATDLEDAVADAATALNTYADEAAEIRTRYLNGAKRDAEAFMEETAGDPEWNKDRDLTDRQDSILAELSALTVELETAQRNCANALSLIWSGKTYGAVDENGRTAPGQVGFGMSSEAYKQLGEANMLTWGSNAEWNYTGFKQGSIAQGITMGMGDGVRELVSYAGSMVHLRGGEKFREAWIGTGQMIYTVSMANQWTPAGHRARMALYEMGKDALQLDLWETDPARAGGRNIFDILTFLIPGGVIAKGISKGGTLAAGMSKFKRPNTSTAPPKAPQQQTAPKWGSGGGRLPGFAGIPSGWLGTPSPAPWRTTMPDPDNPVGPGSGSEGNSSGAGGSGGPAPVPDEPPQYGVRMPNERDPRPGYPGRNPDLPQPLPGEPGPAGGAWAFEPAQAHGGPYQEFVTGIHSYEAENKWLEYVVPVEKTKQTPTGIVKFDSYICDPGPPPFYTFQEAKGHYSFFADWNVLDSKVQEMVNGQFAKQAFAIKDVPRTRLEWNFMEEEVYLRFKEMVALHPLGQQLLEEERLIINWVPEPEGK